MIICGMQAYSMILAYYLQEQTRLQAGLNSFTCSLQLLLSELTSVHCHIKVQMLDYYTASSPNFHVCTYVSDFFNEIRVNVTGKCTWQQHSWLECASSHGSREGILGMISV